MEFNIITIQNVLVPIFINERLKHRKQKIIHLNMLRKIL